MFSKLIQKIKDFFYPKQSTVGSAVPEKKQVMVKLGSNPPPPPQPAKRRTPPPAPPPAREMPRRVDKTVRKSAVGSGPSYQPTRNSNDSSIDPLTAAAAGYIIGSSGDDGRPAKDYVYMGDGTVEEVNRPAQPVVCEPTPTFGSSSPSYDPPSHSSSYDSHSSHSSSSSDSYSSSSYDSGSYDSGSSSSFD